MEQCFLENNNVLPIKPKNQFDWLEALKYRRYLKTQPQATSVVFKYTSREVCGNPFGFLFKLLRSMKEYYIEIVGSEEGFSFLVSFIHKTFFYECGIVKVSLLKYEDVNYVEVQGKEATSFINKFLGKKSNFSTISDSFDYSNFKSFIEPIVFFQETKTLAMCRDVKDNASTFAKNENLKLIYKLFQETKNPYVKQNIIYLFCFIVGKSVDFFEICSEIQSVDVSGVHPRVRCIFEEFRA